MTTRINFGKYYGRLLTDIPDSYLLWLIRECYSMEPALRLAVTAELSRRGDGTTPQSESRALVEWHSIFRTWFAGLARDYHPDRLGADGREMKVINEAARRLREILESA